jgi:hypothetical protein
VPEAFGLMGAEEKAETWMGDMSAPTSKAMMRPMFF